MAIGFISDKLMDVITDLKPMFHKPCFELIYLLEAAKYHARMIDDHHRGIIPVPPNYQRLHEDQRFIKQMWRTMGVHIEFESFLSVTRILLNKSLNCVRPFFRKDLGKSMDGFVDRKDLAENEFHRKAVVVWNQWGSKLKDYRDCTQHYFSLGARVGGFVFKSASTHFRPPDDYLIPDNPEARTRKRLTFQKKIELTKYKDYILEELEQFTCFTLSYIKENQGNIT